MDTGRVIGVQVCARTSTVIVILTRASRGEEKEKEREREGGRRFYRGSRKPWNGSLAVEIEFAAVDVCFPSVAHRQGARFIRADGGEGEGRERKKRKEREGARG